MSFSEDVYPTALRHGRAVLQHARRWLAGRWFDRSLETDLMQVVMWCLSSCDVLIVASTVDAGLPLV
jgi:hypothetical protein